MQNKSNGHDTARDFAAERQNHEDKKHVRQMEENPRPKIKATPRPAILLPLTSCDISTKKIHTRHKTME
jgi:hypothetical protein